MFDDHLALLRCPHCHDALDVREDRQVGCRRGHRYDVARQGYLSLLPPRRDPTTGDTLAMVAARTRFLDGQHYAVLREAVTSAAGAACEMAPGAVVDVGCGPGHYLRDAAERADRLGLGLDLSRPAVRRAATAGPRCAAVVADTRVELPVRDGIAAVVLNVFAPRRGDELRRVMHRDGRLVVVTPTPDHLRELTATEGFVGVDPRKPERVAEQLDRFFDRRSEERVGWSMRLDAGDLDDLVDMGPQHHHRAAAPASSANPMVVTGSVTVATYRPRP